MPPAKGLSQLIQGRGRKGTAPWVLAVASIVAPRRAFLDVTFLQEIKNNQAGDGVKTLPSPQDFKAHAKAHGLHSAFCKDASFGSEFSTWTFPRSGNMGILCFGWPSPYSIPTVTAFGKL
ncbi:hypothetical protein GRJ2_001664700 [Grus japonensis]|uniref:Uncharacterized protein n=1 Tax=Grus japonensis TaxID=30415 RepID=A0ABC9X4R9_GRUJA